MPVTRTLAGAHTVGRGVDSGDAFEEPPPVGLDLLPEVFSATQCLFE
jgi:hypothetical protein